MQLGPYGWEVDANKHLVVRIRNSTFVCPVVDRAQMEMPHFLTVVVDSFGVVEMDDHVMVHFVCPPTASGNPDVPVYVQTPRAVFATVSSKLDEYEPKPLVVASDNRALLRLSSATTMRWRRVLGFGSNAGFSSSPPHPAVVRPPLEPRVCFYPNESLAEKKLNAIGNIRLVAGTAATPKKTKTTRMLAREPMRTMQEETMRVLDEIDDEALSDMVAWYDFYLGGDTTHVLVHLLRTRTFTASEELASALEMAADEVRTVLLRQSAVHPRAPPQTNSHGHQTATFRE